MEEKEYYWAVQNIPLYTASLKAFLSERRPAVPDNHLKSIDSRYY